MNFTLANTFEILERTPGVLLALLNNIPGDWSLQNEGSETWSAFDIVGHLVEGEKTDWIPRMKIILSNQAYKAFEPFDRYAQFQSSQGKTLNQLLAEFQALREENIGYLRSMNISQNQLELTGHHPALGEITLAQLLSTWTVHDLNHIAQISRVMARQYKEEVGPWLAYLKILQK